jgi:hypothetical protein
LIRPFFREYCMVGGTAIALHLGHRRSIDFDLFKYGPIKPKSIIEKISNSSNPYLVTRRVTEQLNITINEVKLTFFQYPFKIKANNNLDNILRFPELIDLAAMKAYAMGRRSKWKDYVDLFFILKSYFTVQQISEHATLLYDQLFSEKLFRAQLGYFDDIDFTEPVEFMGHAIPENEIKEFLIGKAIDF